METPRNNQEFYSRLDVLIEELRRAGLRMHGDRLHHLLYEMVWNSSTELFPAIEEALRSMLLGDGPCRIPSNLRAEIDTYVGWLERL